MIRVALVDPHPIVGLGLAQGFAAHDDIGLVSAVSDMAFSLTMVQKFLPDVLIVEPNFPEQAGYRLLHEMRESYPDIAVLVFTSQPEDVVAMRVLKAGARGILSKSSSVDDVVKAVRIVMTGRRYVSARFAEWLAFDVSGRREAVPHERLSAREFEIFTLLAVGDSVSGIARRLACSPNTVSTHRSRILEKMSIDSNAGLTRYALAHQLIKD